MDIRPGDVLKGPNGADITIEKLQGTGGFGFVFKGQLNGTPVAVKTVSTAALDDTALKTLQNEAALAMEISHPNVVQLTHFSDGETVEGQPPFLVMEFVEGTNLRSVIQAYVREKKSPAIDELLAMCLQIAQGMKAINEKLVHRDIKPENVLVDAATNQLKIADFGLAKLADAATRAETFKGGGTLPYQSPEAFEFGPNTIAMDMYSVGVLFFELATLTWPIKPKTGATDFLSWRNAHLLTPPSSLAAARSDIPASIAQLVTLMLQKNPSLRPSSWQSVIDRLTQPSGTNPGRPDVSSLVQRATTTLLETNARQSQERAEREARAERRALLEQAFREPVEILRDLVDAFNEASEVGKLLLKESDALSVSVTGGTRGARLGCNVQLIDDLDTRYNGIYRAIGTVHVDPVPHPIDHASAVRDRDSCGGFNIVYRVPRQSDRFGTWELLRFELSPITGKGSYPRWFAMTLADLPRELQILNVTGRHQHQKRALDGVWFELLLRHLL